MTTTSQLTRRTPRYSRLDIKGEKNGNAKLTPEKVREIRAAWELRLQPGHYVDSQVFADSFGMSRAAIYAVVHRKSWAHVT